MARISVVVAIPLSLAVGLALAPVARAVQPVVAPTVVQVAAATPAVAPAAVAATSYNLATIATHKTLTSCWASIQTNVYDLTAFALKHSGGSGEIQAVCGIDATSVFVGKHGKTSTSLTSHLATLDASYRIGTYDNVAPTAPTALVATPASNQAGLSWVGPADAVSYQIFQGTTNLGTQAGTTKTVTGLVNNTSYSFTVKAVDAAGNVSAASTAATATPVAPVTIPSVPTGVTATPGNGQVTVSWTASAGATSYQVVRVGAPAVTSTTTSLTVTGLANNTSYSFTVAAVNTAGTSAASTPATATPVVPATAPAAPTGLAATAGTGQVVLTWTATAGATSYQVFQGSTSIGTPATTTYTIAGLTNAIAYSFTVKAVNAVGASPASSSVSATPVATPTGLAATAGDTQVVLTWTATAGATSYQVFQGSTSIGTPATTTFTATGLTNALAYSFTVKAVNSSGASVASTAVSATPVDRTPPAAPTGLAAVAGDTQVSLSWSGPVDAATYQVYRGASLVGTQAGTTTVVTGLPNGILYSFTVKAVDAAGNISVASAGASATPVDRTPPAAPTGLKAVVISARADLSWSGPADAATYQVFQDGGLIHTQVGTTLAVTSLPNGATYSFTVKAVDTAGNASVASALVTASPVAPTTPQTAADVALHSTPTSCWVIIARNVYDLTAFLSDHSGGADPITPVCGKDATATFTGRHSGDVVAKSAYLAQYLQGPLSGDTSNTTLPGYTFAQIGTHGAEADCWAAIGGKVYDLTGFVATHGGGKAPIIGACGTDATTTFYTRHGNEAGAKLGIVSAFLVGNQLGYVAAALPSQAAAPTVEALTGGGEYTMADVAGHNTSGDCWSVIGSGVYQLGAWIPVHPGGSGVVISMCGVDGSAAYNGKHGGSGSAAAILAKIRIGTLVGVKAAPALATYAIADVAAHGTAADCWSVVNGVVYNLTAWVIQHPGGSGVIAAMCGIDASAAYNGKHGASAAIQISLDSMKIGTLTGGSGAVATTTAPTVTAVKSFSMKQVFRHASPRNCWSAVNGNVYNLTSWTKTHPRRTATIKAMCGRNATKAYNRTHGGPARAARTLHRYLIGTVGAPAATPAAVTYSLAQVATHSTPASCWSVVSGGVYDLTAWIGQHPGGAASIRGMCGKDATSSFRGMHSGSASAKAALVKLMVGVVG
jgi:cytochrome b involved in lipid metabolism